MLENYIFLHLALTYVKVNFECSIVPQIYYFLSLSKLPCILQLEKAVTTQWNTLLRMELILVSKTRMG